MEVYSQTVEVVYWVVEDETADEVELALWVLLTEGLELVGSEEDTADDEVTGEEEPVVVATLELLDVACEEEDEAVCVAV